MRVLVGQGDQHASESDGRRSAYLPAILLSSAMLLASAAWAHAETITADSSAGPLELERVAELTFPWGMDFLPDGKIIATERDGRLVIIDPSAAEATRVTEVRGAPDVVARGQGGLLDVTLSPDFAETGLLFLSYSAAGEGGAQTAVDRAVLTLDGAPRLSERETIFRQEPALSGGRHFGSRIVIAADGTLLITLGDRGERESAQDPATHIGKIVRILPSGGAPEDNPFIGQSGVLPEIWSIGHRNPQGAALRVSDGALWTVEHGARGGDEINRPEPGLNYGWPTISYGTHYSGAKIGVGAEAPGFEQPVYYWDPSIAPSGLAFYEGDLFPEWRGDLLAGALKFQLVARLDMEGDQVVGEERLFEREIGRIRDVSVGPEGAIWLLTDDDPGGVWRVTPAN